MGFNLGLDFGTTTSILSYLEGSALRHFHYGGYTGSGTPYVPTVVAYKDNDLFIGPRAVELLPDDGRQYRYFKMLLPEEKRENWVANYGPYQSEDITPTEIATDYIGELIMGESPGRRKLSRGRRNRDSFLELEKRKVDGLVVSVPQVWRDWRARGRQQLQSVVNELGLRLIQLISEPVAAAAFFSHRYQEIQGESYEGNLLVCDMGGGTFDVALCKLSEKSVEVLCNYGNGERGLGLAGAHFDHELLRRAGSESWEPALMADMLVNLDKAKKERANTNQLLLDMQRTAQARIDPIYQISSRQSARLKTFNFMFDDIREAFEPIRDGIFQVLGRVKEEADRGGHEIDRVVLVGGFSKFPLVQQAIGEYFDEDLESRRLIDLDTLTQDEMAFAISYGACLVANDVVQVSEKYEHAISVALYNSSGPDELEEVELIQAGKGLGALDDAVYCLRPDGRERRIKIGTQPVQARLTIRRSGRDDQPIYRNAILNDLPGAEVPDNRWYVGARVDSSKIPYLVIKDEKTRSVKDYQIGDLLSA